ncbi:MAG: hypothetical protein QHC65_04240 [Sphingomonas sp.]|nr:hypothetical protein [Sphingomonas sp.]MDX3883608.1 hypothetical protein [Sphingomonas sp.]
MAEGIAAAGQLIQGVAGYESGRYNRRLARSQAVEAERDGAADEARIREEARLAIGQQLAAQAGSGFEMGSGSALEALTQSQVNATLDALTARRAAASRSRGLRVQGDIAYAQGENALISGIIGAGASGYRAYSDWASAKAGQSGGRRS